MDDNLVSVITPTYNSENYIRECLESVMRQSYELWEMIIVDDCSTDQTFEILKDYRSKDDRIKIYRLEKNKGSGPARNLALKKARGRYVAFLDSDDFWHAQKLSIQVQFMKKTNAEITYSLTDSVDNNSVFKVKNISRMESVGPKWIFKGHCDWIFDSCGRQNSGWV